MMYPCLEMLPTQKQFTWISRQGYTTHWFLLYYAVLWSVLNGISIPDLHAHLCVTTPNYDISIFFLKSLKMYIKH